MTGRLILLVGSPTDDRAEVAEQVADRLGRAVHVDAAALQELVEPQRQESRLLRVEAALLVGGPYAGAGYDVVVTDDLPAADLPAVVNRAAELADQVHLLVLTPGHRGPGLAVDLAGRDPAAVADEVVERLAEARVAPGLTEPPP